MEAEVAAAHAHASRLESELKRQRSIMEGELAAAEAARAEAARQLLELGAELEAAHRHGAGLQVG